MWPYPALAGMGCPGWLSSPRRGCAAINDAFYFVPVKWVFGGQERSEVCEGREEGPWWGCAYGGVGPLQLSIVEEVGAAVWAAT